MEDVDARGIQDGVSKSSVRGNLTSNGRGGSRRKLEVREVWLRRVRLWKRYDGVFVTIVL